MSGNEPLNGLVNFAVPFRLERHALDPNTPPEGDDIPARLRRESELALVYDEKSMFNKIVGRDTAGRRERGEHGASRH